MARSNRWIQLALSRPSFFIRRGRQRMKTVGTSCPALMRLLTIDHSWGTSPIDDNTAQKSRLPAMAAKATAFGGDGSFAARHVTHANTTTGSIPAATEATSREVTNKRVGRSHLYCSVALLKSTEPDSYGVLNTEHESYTSVLYAHKRSCHGK